MEKRCIFLMVLICGLLVQVGTELFPSYMCPQECICSSFTQQLFEVDVECTVGNVGPWINFTVIQADHTATLSIECLHRHLDGEFQSEAFRHLKHLKSLRFQGCTFAEIPNNTFTGLDELLSVTILTLHEKPMIVQSGALSDLPNLNRLNLAWSGISRIPDGELCNTNNLMLLNLTGNKIKELSELGFMEVFNGTRRPCPSPLGSLDLSSNRITSIPATALDGLRDLIILDLSHNQISSVASIAFHDFVHLRILNLANNSLINLPGNLFQNATELTKLDLSQNKLQSLSQNAFQGLGKLEILNLSRNDLPSLQLEGSLRALFQLTVLDLSYNKLTLVNPGMFRELFGLKHLRLDHNNIGVVIKESFANMVVLQILNMDYNQLSAIETHTIQGLHVLTYFSAENNKINHMAADSFYDNVKLQTLKLCDNLIPEMPVLKRFRMIETLDLCNNQINNLPITTFVGMSSLQGIRLRGNNLTTITSGTFAHLPALSIINLSHNKIRTIEKDSFQNLSSLTYLRLDDNKISDIFGLFNQLTKLQLLNLSSNLISEIDYAMFPRELPRLDVHNNNLSLLGNAYAMEDKVQLQYLDASYNHIERLGPSAIPHSIQVLKLTHNKITNVEAFTFYLKANLTSVFLNHNQITQIPESALRFQAVPIDKPLPEFHLSSNPFFECDCTMVYLKRINRFNNMRWLPKIVDLSNIYCGSLWKKPFILLSEKPDSDFLCEYNINCYPLCHCCDFDACDCEMKCPYNCTCYHDLPWQTNIVDCTSRHLSNVPFMLPMDATSAYLDGNVFRNLSSHSFIGRSRLRELYLNNSNIYYIDNSTFNGLIDLIVLHIEGNYLTILNGHEFLHLGTLQELYLNDNRIETIANTTFKDLMMLRILHLQNNHIVTIDTDIFANNVALMQLMLMENPWSCNCEFLQNFWPWVLSNTELVKDLRGLQCFWNQSEPGQLLINANSTECPGHSTSLIPYWTPAIIIQNYFILIVSLGAALLLIIIISIVLYCHRDVLRIWIYAKCGVRFFDKTEDDSNKQYDAFVSYSSHDENFVIRELVPRLEEGNLSYKLCLHYRDFPLGICIAETIIRSIEASRRTVMVLSESYIKSEWCRLEFKTAHHQVLQDRKKRLIVIIYGDIAQDDLDPDLRLYLRTNTYVKWGDPLFWEKLRYAMPDIKRVDLKRKTRTDHKTYAKPKDQDETFIHEIPKGHTCRY